jgi:hypothetical protein
LLTRFAALALHQDSVVSRRERATNRAWKTSWRALSPLSWRAAERRGGRVTAAPAAWRAWRRDLLLPPATCFTFRRRAAPALAYVCRACCNPSNRKRKAAAIKHQ